MVTIVQRPYGFQPCISHELLPKDLWATFDTRDAAEQYARQLEGLLAQGIVLAALLERVKPGRRYGPFIDALPNTSGMTACRCRTGSSSTRPTRNGWGQGLP